MDIMESHGNIGCNVYGTEKPLFHNQMSKDIFAKTETPRQQILQFYGLSNVFLPSALVQDHNWCQKFNKKGSIISRN